MDGATRIDRLHQAGCLKLRFPRLLASPTREAVIVNTAGGLAGGDELDQSFEIAEGAALTVTTQACERVYRSLDVAAEVSTRLRIAPGARLAYLPQETILFDGGRIDRRLDVDAAAGSGFLLCESVILGRTAMGESVCEGLLRDRWRVRIDGRLVFADELRFAGEIARHVAQRASLNGGRAFATILLADLEGTAPLGALRDTLGEGGGASRVGGVVVARLVASDGLGLRRRLVPALSLLAQDALPRLWSS
ncbi:urease accessory protein UreD [Aureimonas mangrovi]|uniref:urease accessory protein UreD n=1 Tax=Aureimonas mangrovi TaxID=2758041 RepID=UPI001FE6553B|nr:urease accessory protein UreD [Aureimonas mangrovi]